MSASTGRIVLRNIVVGVTLALALSTPLRAEDPGARPEPGVEERLTSLQTQVDQLRQAIQQNGNAVLLGLFVFGVFCAVWAQNTGRSAWLWFFLGVIPLVNFFTALVLLAKNARDRRERHRPATI